MIVDAVILVVSALLLLCGLLLLWVTTLEAFDEWRQDR
jgi:hypothetical protein